MTVASRRLRWCAGATAGVLGVALGGCSVVRWTRLRDDWARDDARRIKRIAVVVRLPGEQATVGSLLARMARRYVNHKRDFLVTADRLHVDPIELSEACATAEGLEGVLQLEPQVAPTKGGVELALRGSLRRCSDGREAWAVEAGGSFADRDPSLAQVTASYRREFGPEAERFVAPLMNLLRPTLDTLPQPVLTEDELTEKLSLDD